MFALALLLVGAGCPLGQHPALAAYGPQSSLGIVEAGDPLLLGEARGLVRLYPIENASTATSAAALHAAGALSCASLIEVAYAELRSPVDRSPLDEPLRQPLLAPFKGNTNEGADQEARIARIYDMATFKSPRSARLPMRLSPPQTVNVPGGSALSIALESDAFGTTDRAFGPIIRLNSTATATDAPPYQPLVEPYLLLSPSTSVRLMLDEDQDTLPLGARIFGSRAGFGAIDRTLELPVGDPYDPGDVTGRLLVAHSLGAGLPSLSIGFSLLSGNPGCTVLCDQNDQPIPGDQAFLARFLARSDASVAAADRRLNIYTLALYAAAFGSVVIPTARRGVFSRYEILEDLAVIGEGVLIGLTTPLTLETRFGRARPISFRPNNTVGREGRDANGAPFVAVRTAAASSASSAAITLLFVEEAGPGWVVPAILGLGALTTMVGYSEVDAGRVYPSDIPLGVINGFLSGAGVVLWHRIFWRGWPGDTSRGDLPLRLRGLDLRFANDVAIVTATGEL